MDSEHNHEVVVHTRSPLPGATLHFLSFTQQSQLMWSPLIMFITHSSRQALWRRHHGANQLRPPYFGRAAVMESKWCTVVKRGDGATVLSETDPGRESTEDLGVPWHDGRLLGWPVRACSQHYEFNKADDDDDDHDDNNNKSYLEWKIYLKKIKSTTKDMSKYIHNPIYISLPFYTNVTTFYLHLQHSKYFYYGDRACSAALFMCLLAPWCCFSVSFRQGSSRVRV